MRKSKEAFEYWLGDLDPTNRDKEIYNRISAIKRECPLIPQEIFSAQPTALIERGFIEPLYQKWKHEYATSDSAESFFHFLLSQRKEDWKTSCSITPCHCKDVEKCEHPILKSK